MKKKTESKKETWDKVFSKKPKEKNFLNKDVSFKKKEKNNPLETRDINDITLQDLIEHPEKFLEINIIRENEIIETHYVFVDKKTFKLDNKDYNIVHKKTLHSPRGNYIIPTLYYLENEKEPLDFKNRNIGIPSKVLSLLLDSRLYRMLVHPEEGNLNWVLIILTIINIGLVVSSLFLLHNNGYLLF